MALLHKANSGGICKPVRDNLLWNCKQVALETAVHSRYTVIINWPIINIVLKHIVLALLANHIDCTLDIIDLWYQTLRPVLSDWQKHLPTNCLLALYYPPIFSPYSRMRIKVQHPIGQIFKLACLLSLGRAWASPTLASRTLEFSYMYYISVVRRSVNGSWHPFNPKHCARWVQVRTEYRKEHMVKVNCMNITLLLSPNPEFYSQRFSLHVLFNMGTQSNSRRALKSAQEQEDRRQRRNERDRARRAAETEKKMSERLRKRRERGRARRTAQTASETQATSQQKSTLEHKSTAAEILIMPTLQKLWSPLLPRTGDHPTVYKWAMISSATSNSTMAS